MGSNEDMVATIQCIKAMQSPSCQRCTCTVLCYESPDSEHCRSCLQEEELATLFLNHELCQQGWVWSAVTAKCIKAYDLPRSWMEAETSCKNEGALLAEHQSDSSVVAALEAINLAGPGEYWVGGKRKDINSGFSWNSDKSSIAIDDWNWGPGYPVSPGLKYEPA